MNVNKRMLLASMAGLAIAVASPALAQKKYDTGATDTEIKIGNTNPYSGPASAYGTIGKTIDAYFKKTYDIEQVTTACEYLADQAMIGKASIATRLTKRSHVDVQELAFFSLDDDGER